MAPTFGTVTPSSIVVVLPALPTNATSLSLQMRQGTGTFVAPPGVSATLTGGTSVAIKSLSSSTTYGFRAVANGTGGTTAGTEATQATLAPIPAAPQAPNYLDVTDTTVTVEAPSLPAGATSMTLQQKRTRETSDSFVDVASATGLGSNAQTVVTGLSPDTPYTFRYRCDAAAPNDLGVGTDIRTLAQMGVPGLPTFTNLTSTSVTVTAPPLPVGALSMTLQVRPDSSATFSDLKTGFMGSDSYPVTYAPVVRNTYFRFVTVGGRLVTIGDDRSPTTLPAAPTIAAGSITSHSMTFNTVDTSGTNWDTGGKYNMPGWTLQKRIQGTGDAGWTIAFGYNWLHHALNDTDTFNDFAPSTAYDFRYLADGAAGTAYGAIASFTTTAGPEAGEPGLPTFSNIGPHSVDVRAPSPLPVYADHLKLQYNGGNGWTDVADNLKAGALTTASGLGAATGYTFRYLAISTTTGLTPTDGPRAIATTTTEDPEVPGVPTIGATTQTSIAVTFPSITVPARTASLTLQYKLGGAPDSAWSDWTPIQQPGGTTLTVTGLSAGRSYAFRAKAHPAYGDTTHTITGTAITAYTTAPAPSAPGAPVSIAVVDLNTVDVTAPALPVNADDLTLQGLPDQGAEDYVNIEVHLAPGQVTRVYGLTAGASYRFRYVAVGSGGSTPSALYSSIIMPSYTASWQTIGALGGTISCKGIRIPDPTVGAVTVARGTQLRLCSYLATDWDQRTVTATINGVATNFNIRLSDPCIYYWNVNDGGGNAVGGFVNGVNRAQSATWIAPSTPGTYTATLTVVDQGGANQAPTETGTRADTARTQYDSPLTFKLTVTVS